MKRRMNQLAVIGILSASLAGAAIDNGMAGLTVTAANQENKMAQADAEDADAENTDAENVGAENADPEKTGSESDEKKESDETKQSEEEDADVMSAADAEESDHKSDEKSDVEPDEKSSEKSDVESEEKSNEKLDEGSDKESDEEQSERSDSEAFGLKQSSNTDSEKYAGEERIPDAQVTDMGIQAGEMCDASWISPDKAENAEDMRSEKTKEAASEGAESEQAKAENGLTDQGSTDQGNTNTDQSQSEKGSTDRYNAAQESEDSNRTETIQTDTKQTDTKKTVTKKNETKKTGTEKTETEKTETEKTETKKTKARKTKTEKTKTEKTKTGKTKTGKTDAEKEKSEKTKRRIKKVKTGKSKTKTRANAKKEDQEDSFEAEGFQVDPSMYPAADQSENMRIVYRYLRKELELNHAAACGVLANIHLESSFEPLSLGDGGTSYGICQWHLGRFSALVGYCNLNELDYNTLEGQLSYLAYELEDSYPNVLAHLREVPDTAAGAYDAARFWCMYYEMPDQTEARAQQRGNLAGNEYFPAGFSLLRTDLKSERL